MITPCSSRILRTGAFNAPNKGDRISLPEKPGEYFLITESPQAGVDARGQQFWYASAMDPQGNQTVLKSDDISSWSHFKGQNYPWHEEMLEKRRYEKQQKEQAALVEQFETKYFFNDSRPLKTNPARPLLIEVQEGAQGDLELFSGEQLRVKDIDYQNETVNLEPVDDDLLADPALAAALQGVPAGSVVASAAPALPAAVAMERMKVPVVDSEGKTTFQNVSAEEFMGMIPELTKLADRGQVRLNATVYMNYQKGDKNGEQVFEEILASRGVGLEDVSYSPNNTPRKVSEKGFVSPMYAWTGDVYFAPPVSEEAIEEAKKIATSSQVAPRQDGSLHVFNNDLYKTMLSLGVTAPEVPVQISPAIPAPKPAPIPSVASWVSSNCRLA